MGIPVHTVIFDGLTAVGAGGGLIAATRFAGRRISSLRQVWMYRKVQKDYYVRHVELGYRIQNPGSLHILYRTEEIVSLRQGLDSVRLRWVFDGDTKVTEEYSGGVVAENVDGSGSLSNSTHRRLELRPPLDKKQSRTITMIRRVSIHGKSPSPYLSWSPKRRTESARLRVVFQSPAPPAVEFVEVTPDGRESDYCALPIDQLTLEARKDILHPALGWRYEIRWDAEYS